MLSGLTMIRRRPALLAGAGLALDGRRAAAQRQPQPPHTFEDAPTGAPPPGFSFALTGGGGPVRWVVIEDPSAPAGPKVLADTESP